MRQLRYLLFFFLWIISANGQVVAANKPRLLPQGLKGALNAAMRHHPSIKQKDAVVQSSEFAIKSSKSRHLPSVSSNMDLFTQNSDNRVRRQQGSVAVKLNVWSFGKITAGVNHAKAVKASDIQSLLVAKRQLIEDTSVAYNKVVGIYAKLDVATGNIKTHQEFYDRIKRRHAGGLSSSADVQLAYSRLVQALALTDQLNGDLFTALNELKALTIVKVKVKPGESLPHYLLGADGKTLKSLAMQHEASIALQRSLIGVEAKNVTRQKLAIFPDVYIKGQHDFQNRFSGNSNTWIGVSVEGNVDGLGMVSINRTREAAEQLNAAKYQLDTTVNQVMMRVSSLVIQRKTMRNLVTLQKRSVKALQMTRNSYYRQYRINKKSWLDVLNSQRELTQMKIKYVEYLNEERTLSLRLAAMTGRLDRMAHIR